LTYIGTRPELWNPDKFLDPAHLPTPGQIPAYLSNNGLGGGAYDKCWKTKAKESIW